MSGGISTGFIVLIIIIVALLAAVAVLFVRTRRPRNHEIGLPEVGTLLADDGTSSAEAKAIRAENREQGDEEPPAGSGASR